MISVCPTSDSNYHLVNGQCFYFENKILKTYTDAKANCADKMERYGRGRLFEPQTLEMSYMVAKKGNYVLDTGSPFHIVNDINLLSPSSRKSHYQELGGFTSGPI